jgi:hypothetical protein
MFIMRFLLMLHVALCFNYCFSSGCLIKSALNVVKMFMKKISKRIEVLNSKELTDLELYLILVSINFTSMFLGRMGFGDGLIRRAGQFIDKQNVVFDKFNAGAFFNRYQALNLGIL